MKNVLIALDYDPSALIVAETGYLLVQTMNAKVTFLHVVSDLTIYSNVGQIVIKGFFAGHMNTNTELAKTPINEKDLACDFLNKMKFHLGNQKIKTIIKEGDSASSILVTANDFNIDLIVMGSHSRNWSDNGVLGNTTQAVLLGTSIPLFIVPIKKSYY